MSMWAYPFHELAYNSIPLLRLAVVDAVHMIRHQTYRVLESNLAGNATQQIYAETLEPVVSGKVFVFPQHNVGLLL